MRRERVKALKRSRKRQLGVCGARGRLGSTNLRRKPTPLRCELLEPRRLLAGTIRGVVFDDANFDGVYGPEDTSLPDWTVELQPAGTSDFPQLRIENPRPGDAASQFGRFVAAWDDKILVGAHYSDSGGTSESGAAYLFDSTDGELLHSFQSPDPQKGDKFGRAVAGIDNKVVVGAPWADAARKDKAGAVYVFDSETGSPLHTLTSPSPGDDHQFGRAVAIVGDGVLVGARLDDTQSSEAGAAYLYDMESGDLIRSFFSPNPARGAQFGYTVASTSDGNVLVGARYDETGSDGKGAVYMFDRQTGNLLQTFVNPTQRPDNERTGFARSIASVGDNVLVAARFDDSGADLAGAAFLFSGATGELIHTFTSPTPERKEEFGFHVAAAGNDVLVGARFDRSEGSVGAAYLFDSESGQLLQTFANPEAGSASDEFGVSVSLLGSSVIVGTKQGDAVYMFDSAPGSSTITTTEDGEFVFDDLEPGRYRVVIHERAGAVITTSNGDNSVSDVSDSRPSRYSDSWLDARRAKLVVSSPNSRNCSSQSR